MKAIVSLSSDKNLFAKRLVELSEQKFSNGTSHAREVLERLRDYGFEKIPKENISNIVEALFDIGDKLLIDGDKGQEMFDYDNNVRIGRALWPLFGRNDKDTNLTILKKAIQNGSALCTICREVGVFGQQHGKNGANGPDPEREQFTTADGLKELEDLSAKKIREAAEKGILLDTVQLNGVLYRWKDWAGEKEVQKWVKETIQEDNNLIKLLEKFLSYTISYSSKVVKHPRLDPEWLKPFIEIESIIVRVRKLSKRKKLTLVQKEALNRFLKEYEIRKEGKDPSNPLAYDK
jgi:predicted KAP-like P-loop ATPase